MASYLDQILRPDAATIAHQDRIRDVEKSQRRDQWNTAIGIVRPQEEINAEVALKKRKDFVASLLPFTKFYR